MKILLTGAGGFTGKPFAALARAAGHQVIGLDVDLGDRDGLQRQVSAVAPDSVVHLAALSFVGEADAPAIYAVNVIGTLNLLDALLALPNPPRSVLLASSATVYGNCADSPISEAHPVAPTNHYAMSKLAMEHLARTYRDRLPLVMTRPFNYTGPGQAAKFLVPKLVAHFAQRARAVELGNLHVAREFNDIDMVCAAYLALAEHGPSGETYNICTGRAYSLQQVIDMLSAITGHRLEVKVNPAFVRQGEVHRLCGNPSKLREFMARQGGLFNPPSLEHTLRRMLDVAGNR